MHKFIVRKIDDIFFDFLSFSEEATILSWYLSDIRNRTQHQRFLLENLPLYECGSGNSTYVCKQENCIEIGFLYDDDNICTAEISFKNFSMILDNWDKIHQLQPNWVVIYFDKDSISMTPYHELPDEELADPKKCYSASSSAFDLYEERIDRKRRTRLGNFFHKTLKQIKTYCKPYLGDD